MDYESFSNELKSLNLSREEFAKLVNMNYYSIANWKQKGLPSWVEPFLTHYKKSKEFDNILKILEKYR